MKYRKYLLPPFALLLVLASVVYWLKNIQHVPSDLVIQSVDFINKLNDGQLKSAYNHTTKKGELFNSLETFKQKTEKEFFNHIHLPDTNNKEMLIQYQSTFPLQTYGNRLRRKITGKKVDMDWISLDFFLFFKTKKGAQSVLPFETRWRLEQNGAWKIFYFQSHAA